MVSLWWAWIQNKWHIIIKSKASFNWSPLTWPGGLCCGTSTSHLCMEKMTHDFKLHPHHNPPTNNSGWHIISLGIMKVMESVVCWWGSPAKNVFVLTCAGMETVGSLKYCVQTGYASVLCKLTFFQQQFEWYRLLPSIVNLQLASFTWNSVQAADCEGWDPHELTGERNDSINAEVIWWKQRQCFIIILCSLFTKLAIIIEEKWPQGCKNENKFSTEVIFYLEKSHFCCFHSKCQSKPIN